MSTRILHCVHKTLTEVRFPHEKSYSSGQYSSSLSLYIYPYIYIYIYMYMCSRKFSCTFYFFSRVKVIARHFFFLWAFSLFWSRCTANRWVWWKLYRSENGVKKKGIQVKRISDKNYKKKKKNGKKGLTKVDEFCQKWSTKFIYCYYYYFFLLLKLNFKMYVNV